MVPVSTALIGIAVRRYAPLIAGVLAAVGIVGQLIFGVYRTGQLWQGGRDPRTTTPVLYLPTVAGSFISTIRLSVFRPSRLGRAVFRGVGVLSWLAIESVLAHRLYAIELPPPLRPTLGIQLAPPTVGCAAYLSITSGLAGCKALPAARPYRLQGPAGCKPHPMSSRNCCSAMACSRHF